MASPFQGGPILESMQNDLRFLPQWSIAFCSSCPGTAGTAPPAAEVPAPPASFAPQIASSFDLSQAEVSDANPQIDDIELIQPGQVLYLPCPGEAAPHACTHAPLPWPP